MSVLELKSVHCLRGRRPVLDGVDLRVAPGEVVALTGPNGAGKTTAILAAAGAIAPTSGQILFDGRALSAVTRQERGRRIAYLAQTHETAWLIAVRELAALGRFAWGGRRYDRLAAQDRASVDEALSRADITALSHTPVGELSGGEQARAHLARMLATRADLILADEPCAALDPRHQLDAMAVLRAEAARGAGVVIALHDLSLAERFADRIVVLDAGRVAANAPAADALGAEVLATVFGVRRREGGGFEPA